MHGCLVPGDHCDTVASPSGHGGIAGALGCPVPGEQLPQEAASPLGALARLCQRIPKTEMENLAENANSQLREENLETGRQAGNTQPHAAPPESLGRASSLHGDGLPALPGQQSLQGTSSRPAIVPSKMEPAQGLENSRQARPKLRASWSKATLPWQQHCLEEEELPEQMGHDHLASLPWLDGRAGQANPELTGLEGLEAISSQQKVLEWLKAYFGATTTYALPTLPWQDLASCLNSPLATHLLLPRLLTARRDTSHAPCWAGCSGLRAGCSLAAVSHQSGNSSAGLTAPGRCLQVTLLSLSSGRLRAQHREAPRPWLQGQRLSHSPAPGAPCPTGLTRSFL
ncbi:uncharacterized protein LOC116786252 [Chiroxiphia lanceolata]|uniref:uncharacterized protein LOC116786252 n=1 Tax=Chiroxiphia lanceolata TaxID=296741 RepID=UPI0013CECF2B|nr:uncharacterized protein LOC116786252 [Chiroxiphia lanceolata]